MNRALIFISICAVSGSGGMVVSMELFAQLSQILDEGRRIWDDAEAADLTLLETVMLSGAEARQPENRIVLADNLNFMKALAQNGMADAFNLIYADPPFFSKRSYEAEIKLKSEWGKTIPAMKQKAYEDEWEGGLAEYLRVLVSRFYAFHELLSNSGSLWVHLDWHSAHYVKILLDAIFGEKNFVNEVIWNYKSGGVSKRRFARKHDTLLFYGKTPAYYFAAQKEKSYNRELKPYRFKGVKEYKDEGGWYTMVNMKDVWQLDMVGRTSAERTGYATQKPESLITRILKSCTKEGDLCADFFCGSGTLAAAADKMGRRWVLCDSGRLAVVNSQKRMVQAGAAFSLTTERGNEDMAGEFTAEYVAEDTMDSTKKLVRVTLKRYAMPVHGEARDETASAAEGADDAAGGVVSRTDDVGAGGSPGEGYAVSVPVDKAYVHVINEILESDSLRLVDYWSVDFRYNGIEFRPQAFASKVNDCVDESLARITGNSVTIAVRVVDIFGNSSFRVL